MKRMELDERNSSAGDISNEMTSPSDPATEFVVCICNDDYPASLERHKIYRVLPDADAAADGDFRVVDESGEGYLYPVTFFSPISVSPELEEALLTTP